MASASCKKSQLSITQKFTLHIKKCSRWNGPKEEHVLFIFFCTQNFGIFKVFLLIYFFTYWRWFWCVVVFRCFENENFFYTGESALFPKMRPRVAHTGPNVAPINPTTTWKKEISYYFFKFFCNKFFDFCYLPKKETAIKMYIYKSRYD